MAQVTIQSLYDEARHALETGAIDRAIGISQHLLAHFPHFIEAFRLRGEAQLSQQRLDEAIEDFKYVLRADPESIPAHVGLGIAYERQGSLESAIAEFEQAMEIKPDLPELRNQLLRLYAEAQGTEGAQLRLSKAGLARLYAKGHMLPHSIQEFEDVLASQPDRRDVQVALAEALWRNDQEDEAATLCRTILNEDPEVLKARLILGYILYASSDPEGEQLWLRAQEQDPYLGMARMLFDKDILPPIQGATTLPEWSEAIWREEQQRREHEEQQRREREEQQRRERELAAEEQAVQAAQPVEAQAQQTGAPQEPAFSDEDFFSGSWLQAIEDKPIASDSMAGQEEAPAMPSLQDEDLLATLLAGAETVDQPDPPHTMQDTMAGESQADLSPAEPLGDIKPFSLDELEGDEPAWLAEPTPEPQAEQPSQPTAEESQTPQHEAETQPFSLDELALDVEPTQDATPTDQGQQLSEPDLEEFAGLQPFSFDDIEDDDAPIGGLPGGMKHESPTGPPPGLQPFSLDDIEGRATPQDPAGDLPAGMQPFSLEDIEGDATAQDPAGDLPAGMQPFSLEDIDLDATPQDPPYGQTADDAELPSNLQPFSLDELALDNLDTDAEPNAPIREIPVYSESEGESEGFSWQDSPPRKQEGGFAGQQQSHDDEDGPSIFSKLLQRRNENETPEDDQQAAQAPGSEELPEIFSMDEVDLRGAIEEAQSTAPTEQLASTAEEQQGEAQLGAETDVDAELKPFSLEELGLGTAESAETLPPQEPETLAFEEQDAPAAEQPPAQDEPQLQPFSLADLGLSNEEISSLEQQGQPAQQDEPAAEQDPAQDEPQLQPFSFEEQPPAQEQDPAQDEPQLQPFSLADLGLSDEDIPAPDTLGQDAQQAPEPEAPAEPQPFSFAEQPGAAGGPPSILETLTTLGRQQGYVDVSDIMGYFPDPESQAEEIEELGMQLHQAGIQIRDGDEIIDMEETEDTSSETQPPATEQAPSQDEPQLQPFSLADLGLSDEEITSLGQQGQPAQQDEPAAEQAPSQDEPQLQPFSLADLGLSDEDIPAPDTAGQSAQQAPEPEAPAEQAPAQDEPELTPFTLADMGLSEEDSDSGKQQGQAPGEDEPQLQPFSLAELGLSDEDIPAPDTAENVQQAAEPEAPAEQQAPAQDEPQLQPFSLAELGLSEEEIAALEQQGQPSQQAPEPEAPAEQAPAQDEPELTPFTLADMGLSEEDNDSGKQQGQAPGEKAASVQDAAAMDAEEQAFLEEQLLSFESPTADDDQHSRLQQPSEEQAPGTAEPDLQPFSLDEIGLSDDEVASDSSAQQDQAESPSKQELALSEEELAAFDFDISSSQTAGEQASEPPAEPASQAGAPEDSFAGQPPAQQPNLAEFQEQVEADPGNHPLRLALARMSERLGQFEQAVAEYKTLIKCGALLEPVVDDLIEMIGNAEDPSQLHRLHRLLGDAYMKQSRWREAMDEYSWVLTKPRS